MGRKIYNPEQPTGRRKEWVEFPDGRSICVWGLTVSEYTTLQSRSTRAPGDPRGEQDKEAASLIQIVLSCYNSDETDAKRIYGDLDLGKVGALTFEEFRLIAEAISRANGLDSSLQEIIRDFTAATKEQGNS